MTAQHIKADLGNPKCATGSHVASFHDKANPQGVFMRTVPDNEATLTSHSVTAALTKLHVFRFERSGAVMQG